MPHVPPLSGTSTSASDPERCGEQDRRESSPAAELVGERLGDGSGEPASTNRHQLRVRFAVELRPEARVSGACRKTDRARQSVRPGQ
jgi:hypothetical protein